MKLAPRFLLAWLLGAACAALPCGAIAKDKSEKKEAEPVEVPEKLTPEQADALLARLTDAQARQLLARQLHKQAEKQAAAQTGDEGGLAMLIVHLRRSVEESGERSARRSQVLAEGWRQFPDAAAATLEKVSNGRGIGGLLLQMAVFAAIATAGLLASSAFWRSAIKPHVGAAPPVDAGFGARLAAALLRLTLELVPLAVFGLVVFVVVRLLYAGGTTERTLQDTLATGALLIYAVVIASRFGLSPDAAGRRMLAIDDRSAAFAHRWIVRIVSIWIVTLVVSGMFLVTGVAAHAQTFVRLVNG
ncbi:MAG: hypothetical protein ACRET8_10905, partial [Burkholderiales bacterium]